MSDTLYNPLKLAETTDSSLPPNGFQKLQAKPDGNLYVVDSQGNQKNLTQSGGSLLIDEVTTDLLNPVQGQIWVLKTVENASGSLQAMLGGFPLTLQNEQSRFELTVNTSDGLRRILIK